MDSASALVTYGPISWMISTHPVGEAMSATKTGRMPIFLLRITGTQTSTSETRSKGYFLYQLPFGRGKQFLNNNTLLDAIIGGWQISDTLVVQSGQPFTPVMQTDTSYSLAGSNFTLYPNLIGNPTLASRGVKQWFNEAAFAPPAAGTFGNVRQEPTHGARTQDNRPFPWQDFCHLGGG